MDEPALKKLSFASSSLLTFGSRMLSAGLQMLLRFGIALYLGAAQQGHFYSFLQYVLLLAIPLGLGLKNAGSFEIRQPQSEPARIISSTLLQTILTIVTVIAGAYLFWPLFSCFLPGTVSRQMVLLTIASAGMFSLFLTSSEFLLSIRDVVGYNICILVNAALSCILFLVAIRFFHDGLTAAAGSWVGAIVLAGLLSMILLLRRHPFTFDIIGPKPGPRFRYGLFICLSGIIALANFRIGFFLVRYFEGAYQAGIYSMATMLAESVWFVPDAVGLVLFPALAGSEISRQTEQGIRALRHIMGWSFLLGLMVLCAGTLFLLTFGRSYHNAMTPFILLLPGVVVFSAGKTLSTMLISTAKVQFTTIGSVLILACTILFNLVLLPRFGLNGAAIATSGAYCVGTFYALAIYGRITGTKWHRFFIPEKEDIDFYRNLLPITRRSGT